MFRMLIDRLHQFLGHLELKKINAQIDLGTAKAADHSRKGEILHALGDLDAASCAFERAIELDPTHASAYRGRAVLHFYQDSLDASLEDLSECIRLEPSQDHYQSRARINHHLGRKEAALADYNRALESRDATFDLLRERGIVFLDLGRFTEANADFSQAIGLKRRAWEIYALRGHALMEKGEHAAAVRDYSIAISREPTTWALSGRANALLCMGDLTNSLADCRCGIELEKDHESLWITQGWCLLCLGQPQESEQSFRHVLTINPRNGDACAGLAWNLLVTQQTANPNETIGKDAHFLITEMKSLQCGLDEYWKLRIQAAVHAELCEFDEACRLMDEAINVSTDKERLMEQYQAYQDERCYRATSSQCTNGN